jgi:hypothetical protein
MILAVTKVEKIYIIDDSLSSFRYRFGLGLEEVPEKTIILLRTGITSTSGHYLLLAETPFELKTIQADIEVTNLSTSELSISSLETYSI